LKLTAENAEGAEMTTISAEPLSKINRRRRRTVNSEKSGTRWISNEDWSLSDAP
jgi:hypothetical protein